MKDILALMVAFILILFSHTRAKGAKVFVYSLSALLGAIAFFGLNLLEDQAWFSQVVRAVLFFGFCATVIGFALGEKQNRQRK